MSYVTVPTLSTVSTTQKEPSPKMHPRIKQLWLDALRSGEYEQGAGRLHSEGGFCCLGVLCDLYAKENGASWTQPTSDEPNDYGMNGEYVYLPKDIAQWANINQFGVIVRGDHNHIDLADMNDKGQTFVEIAEAIDENL